MIETELSDLEAKINQLIAALRMARLESNSLRKKIAQLNQENLELLARKKQAAGAIKELMMELQDELH